MAITLHISVSSASFQHQNNVSNPPYQNPISPNCKQKVRNGGINNSYQLFVDLPERNEVSLSTTIASYARCGNFSLALDLFEKMIGEGLRPNGFALVCLLKAISAVREIGLSRQLHSWVIRAGFGLDVGVRAALITMYAYFGMLSNARRVFDEVPSSSCFDVQLWNSIIAAYVLHRCWTEVFLVFVEMLSIALVAPSELTYASVIGACGSAGEEKYGAMIHGRIVKSGMREATHVWNSLVTFYAKCGDLEDANRLFERIFVKDVVSWNAIIAANEQNGRNKNAMDLFCRMISIGPPVQPNRVTFLSVLSAVSRLASLKQGREIHARVIRLGLEEDNTIVNSLLTMYSKCKELSKAELVFERFLFKDVITWNSMLAAFEQAKQHERCFDIFRKMQPSGIELDSHSFSIILNAVSSESSRLMYLRRGQEIHGYILRRTSLEELSLPVSNAILTMYAEFNRMVDAEKIFRKMRKKDSYSWNAMMDGYCSNHQFECAFMIFMDMLSLGLPFDDLSFSILLSSCGKLVSLQLGKQLHSLAAKLFYDQDSAHPNCHLSIKNAMLSMYAKCGNIKDATQVFKRMERKDVFSWSAMITGYAEHGMASESLQLFERMKADGAEPNEVTFLGVLMACAHGGLVEKGTHYFHSMANDYGLKPSIEHYACMVDLFGRSGQFDSAKNFVESGVTLFKPHHHCDALNLWRVLLGACHAHKQLELGVEAALKILELAPEDEATYILLSNLYASSGLWEDAIRVRKAMSNKGLSKEVGCSWIDIGNRRHIFVAGDVYHP